MKPRTKNPNVKDIYSLLYCDKIKRQSWAKQAIIKYQHYRLRPLQRKEYTSYMTFTLFENFEPFRNLWLSLCGTLTLYVNPSVCFSIRKDSKCNSFLLLLLSKKT